MEDLFKQYAAAVARTDAEDTADNRFQEALLAQQLTDALHAYLAARGKTDAGPTA